MRKADLAVMVASTLIHVAIAVYFGRRDLRGGSMSPEVPSVTNGVATVSSSVDASSSAERASKVDVGYAHFTAARIGRPARPAVQLGGGVYFVGEVCPLGRVLQIRPDALLLESLGRLRIVWRSTDGLLDDPDDDEGGQEDLPEGSSSRAGG